MEVLAATTLADAIRLAGVGAGPRAVDARRAS
jgi:hypothetical protein